MIAKHEKIFKARSAISMAFFMEGSAGEYGMITDTEAIGCHRERYGYGDDRHPALFPGLWRAGGGPATVPRQCDLRSGVRAASGPGGSKIAVPLPACPPHA